jgi:chromosome segregation ATPase
VTETYLGLAIEALVAVLLVAAIVYCAILDRRLKRLRADETTMRETVTELVAATHGAERAIAALRATVAQSEETLAERLGRATALSEQMAGQLGEGERVIGRITRIAKAAREHGERQAAVDEAARADAARREEAALAAPAEPPMSASAAAAAAAEMFANRVRALSLGAAT